MKKKIKNILFGIIVLFLSGCIQQDMRIVLNADGSGEYHIRKTMSPMEGAMIANIPPEMREKALAEQQGLQEEYPGGLKRVFYDLSTHKNNPAQFIETSKYVFSNLGEALPSLENLIEMGPRYAYRGDHFVVFRNREKEKWDGFSNNSEKEEDLYFNLTMELPAEPISSNGTVSGKTVSWKFDKETLKRYQKMPIGESFIEVSIPSEAIKVDLSPRLFQKKETKISQSNVATFQPLEWFNANFLIKNDVAIQDEVKASLHVVFPIEEINLPVSYKNLVITSLVVDGKEVDAVLTSKPMGVFDGKNQWGRKARGFPVNLEFPITNPWVKTIDKVTVQMDVNAVAESHRSIFEIKDKYFPRFIASQKMNNFLKKIVITKIENGTSAMWPAAGITLLTMIKPTNISAVFLDTEYGLRYKAEVVNGKLKKRTELQEQSVQQLVKENFMEEVVYEYIINFNKIPNQPFNLLIDVITKSNFQPQTLILENIDVSP